MFKFLKLDVYNSAKIFYYKMYEISVHLKLNNYMKDQLSRAAFSVPLNIAEGTGKFSKRDQRNFFVIARASLFECIAIIDILAGDKRINREDYNSIINEAEGLSRQLYTMIGKLS